MAAKKYPKNIANEKSEEDDDKVLMCFICSVEERWKDHKRRKEHTSKLPYFTEKFIDNSSDHVRCESCKNQISKDSFVQHARRHKLIPWYRPKDEFITYFKNFIKPTCEKYYCRLCVQECETWYSSLSHIDCKNHKSRLKNYIGKEDIDEAALSSDICENLVTNDIFPFRFTQLQCWTCNFIIDGYETPEDHIASEVHKNNLARKKIKIVTRKLMKLFIANAEVTLTHFNNNTNSSMQLDSTEVFKNSLDVNESTVNDNSSECDNEIVLILILCLFFLMIIAVIKKIFISLKNILLFSVISIGIYLLYCFLHDILSKKPTAPTSDERVIEKWQVKKDSILNDLKTFSTLEYLVLYELFRNFIFHNASKDYYCYFCQINLPFKFLLSNAREHLKDSKHQNIVQKNKHIENIANESSCTPITVELLVRNNIFQVDNSFLRCFTCYCLISSYSCALEHLEDLQHEINWNNLLDEIFKPLHLSEMDESFVNEPNNESIAGNEIIQSVETNNEFLKYFENCIFMDYKEYYCHKCEHRLSSKISVMEHIKDVTHQTKLEFEKENEFFSIRIPCEPNIYEKLVQNNVFRFNYKSIICYTCRLVIYTYKNVEEHINSQRHKERHGSFSITLLNLEQKVNLSNLQVSNQTQLQAFNNLVSTDQSNCKLVSSAKLLIKNDLNSHFEVRTADSQSSIASIESKKTSPCASRVRIFHSYRNTINNCYICRERLNSAVQYHIHLSGHYWRFFTDTNKDLESFVNIRSKYSINIRDTEIRLGTLNIVDEHKLFKWLSKRKIFGQQGKVKSEDLRDEGKNEITLENLDVELRGGGGIINIYEMNEEIHHMIQLSFSRICIIDKNEIYCMICRKNVNYYLQNVYEHFRSIEHSYFLMQMIQDDLKFEEFPDEFSDFNLARELIEDKSDHHVVCFVCDSISPTIIPNETNAIQTHISSRSHQERRSELNRNLQEFRKSLEMKLVCNWFNVQIYWCVICSRLFKHENNFCEHLKSKKHHVKSQNFIRFENLIYDFCPTCGTLLYGFKNTFTYHSNCWFHKFYVDKSIYYISCLPTAVEKLVTNAEENLMNKLAMLEENNATMRKEEQLVLKDLEIAINGFGDAKIHPFGSRITGLGSMNSDLDIFLDCYDSYYKGNKLDDVLEILSKVEDLLKQKEETWTIKRIITNCRIPIIKLMHNTANIDCDISFTNGISIENSKLVKAYVDKYTLCKKLILFLKDWINACNLSGKDGISSYAIAWMVIYYLQTMFIVPSVAELIKIEGKSCVIGGWETGASNDFTLPDISIFYSFKELLKGFFIMFAVFDYRNNILCPLLGRPIKKIDFVVSRKLSNLPEEMVPYKNYIKNKNAECFRSDSVMGVQDPFDLSHNLTKSVKKFVMYRFRTYCAMSANELIN